MVINTTYVLTLTQNTQTHTDINENNSQTKTLSHTGFILPAFFSFLALSIKIKQDKRKTIITKCLLRDETKETKLTETRLL